MSKTIDRRAMDALLVGVSKSLDYLGAQKRTILDKMGVLMLEYLIDVGEVKSPNKPKEFAKSLRKLLTKNGFGARIPLKFKGTPPGPLFSNFVDYLKPGVSRYPRRDRTSLSEGRSKGRKKVDWVLYEMALYGTTKALDQLGAQAQLILNRVGTEMLDYLVKIGAIEWSDDSNTLFQRVKDFFIKAGYASSVEIGLEGSPPHTMTSTYKDARYYDIVLRRLQNEGSILFSCPMCLVGTSILSRAQGIKIQFATELRFLPGHKVFLSNKIYGPTERFTEEDEQKISRMSAK